MFFSLWWGQQEAKRFRFARSEPLFIRPFSILKRNRYHKSENHREDFKNSPLLVSSTRPFTSIINGRAHQWVKVEKSWFFLSFLSIVYSRMGCSQASVCVNGFTMTPGSISRTEIRRRKWVSPPTTQSILQTLRTNFFFTHISSSTAPCTFAPHSQSSFYYSTILALLTITRPPC